MMAMAMKRHPAVWTVLAMAIVGALRAFSKATITEEQTQAIMVLFAAVGSAVGYNMPSPREQKAKKLAGAITELLKKEKEPKEEPPTSTDGVA